jgi:hypothetical protein
MSGNGVGNWYNPYYNINQKNNPTGAEMREKTIVSGGLMG